MRDMSASMKFIAALVSIFLFWAMLSADSAYAGGGSQLQKEEKNVSTIKNKNLEGTVEVSFKINTDGEVDILNIQSTNPELIDYVVRKLKQIQLEDKNEIVGKTIHYRFVFKKQV